MIIRSCGSQNSHTENEKPPKLGCSLQAPPGPNPQASMYTASSDPWPPGTERSRVPDPPTTCRGVPRTWTRHRQWPRRKASGSQCSSLLPSRISSDTDQRRPGGAQGPPRPVGDDDARRSGPPALSASDRSYAASFPLERTNPTPKANKPVVLIHRALR